MAKTWLSIKVELIEGRGERLWPRPGRLIAATRRHTFDQLARCIDTSFVRWDVSHLQIFELTDLRSVVSFDFDEPPANATLSDETSLSQLKPDEQFAYTFDLGDRWRHLCTVGAQRVDPYALFGTVMPEPTVYFGWGTAPDQYGRRTEDDDGSERPLPPDPGYESLPPLQDHWGPPRPPGPSIWDDDDF